MLPRRWTVPFLAIAVLLQGCVHTPRPTSSLSEVIGRHVAARGGAEALDRVKQIAIDLEINEGGQIIEGRYAADPANLVRIDIYGGGKLVYREGVDKEGVWLWPGGDPQPKPSTATGSANALLNGAEMHLFGLHRFAERGHRLRLMPPETIDGVEYQVIEAVLKSGHTSYFFMDPQSWLITRRRDERAYHPDLDLTKQRIETRYSDFRRIDGILFPFVTEDYDLNSGKLISTQIVKRVKPNPGLTETEFDRDYETAQSLS